MSNFNSHDHSSEEWERFAELDERLSREDYDREVHVAFPYRIAQEFQSAGVCTSMRDFLTWMAERNPEEACRLLGIRDAYYCGDHEDDYGDLISDLNNFPLSTEERALLRAERHADQGARDKRREAIERDNQRESDRQAMLWSPYRDRLQQLDLKLSRLKARWDQLDAEWDAFLVARERWGVDRPTHEATEKRRLDELEQKIGADQKAWADAMSELREVVHGTAHKRAA